MNNLRMSIKLTVAFSAICLVIAVSSFTIYRSLGVIAAAEKSTVHTYVVIEQLSKLVSGMVNSETGLRGYLIGGDTAFLAPLESGQKDYQAAVTEVGRLTSDNPRQQARLEKVKSLGKDWFTNVAQEEIAFMKDPSTQAKAREMESSGAGKKFMDGLRALVAEMDSEERSLLTTRAAESQAATDAANMTTIVSAGATLVLSILCAVGLTLVITRPIQRMTNVMNRLATVTRRCRSRAQSVAMRLARWRKRFRYSRTMPSR